MKEILNQTMDEERALYNLTDALVKNCTFAGPADGESALKESRRIRVEDTSFSLRYPLWHVDTFEVSRVTMDEKTRAALWYDRDGVITSSKLHGVKAVRECTNITLTDCDVDSTEFGWKSSDITLEDTSVTSEYLFLDSKNIVLKNVKMKGKYSFQYVENLTITDSDLDTKDAFWHAKNVTVKDSTVKGEYLAWFSDHLTLINCKIIGTQPLCYCTNLKLVNCTMEAADFAFEYSDVEAELNGTVISVKNPRSGMITLDEMPELIMEDAVMECSGKVVVRQHTGAKS
ncbi:MAG: DUF3737 family protein [Lachnospiraceae bacterium]|nr:DUF3737 family protein [Lachnospiraceae bacterium]